MNLAELQAIDSRLKRVAAGESIREVYGGISAEPALDSVRMIRALYDPTPIDEAWLEEFGGIEFSAYLDLYLVTSARHIRIVRVGDQWHCDDRKVTTRGQLLFLLLGLGVFDE